MGDEGMMGGGMTPPAEGMGPGGGVMPPFGGMGPGGGMMDMGDMPPPPLVGDGMDGMDGMPAGMQPGMMFTGLVPPKGYRGRRRERRRCFGR